MSTKIEWCKNPDGTEGEIWNPIRTADGGYHCTKVSEGCANCYAERFNNRFGNKKPFDNSPTEFVLDQKQIEKLLHWKKPRRVFVQSMGDIFHEGIPESLFFQIYVLMEKYPQHTFILLTKRIERAAALLYRFTGRSWPLNNCWLGVTAENQARADERIPILLQTPAAVRFVSIEPMLGPVNIVPYIGHNAYKCECGWHETGYTLNAYGYNRKLKSSPELAICNKCGKRADIYMALNQVICGGETGPGATPMHPEWARSLRDQCQAAGTAFFFKSWGNWCYPEQMPRDTYSLVDAAVNLAGHGDYNKPWKVGKKKAGRLLDGVEWSQYPEVQP